MKFLDDIFFLIGLLVVVATTFFINLYVGCYLVGVLFIVFSIVIGKLEQPKEERGE